MPATIVDWAGRPIERGQRPGGGKAIVPGRGAWYDTLGTDITPKLIIAYLKTADHGNLAQQMQLFDRMVDRDDRLQTVLETRKLAITGIDRAIQPRIPEDPRSEKAAELCREMFADQLENTLSFLLDAVPKGLAGGELIWDGSTIVAIDEIPPRLMRYEDTILEINYSGGGGKIDWRVPEPYKFVMYSYRNKPGAKERRGLLRALSILWVAKHWALRDWAAFVEVFGMPLRLGVYPENALEEQKTELYDAIQDLGADSAAIIQENMKIEFPRVGSGSGNTSSNGSSGTPMESLIGYADTSYAIRVLGQNLTTESQSGTGSLAGGAHENVRGDYKKADAKSVSAVVENDIFGPAVGFNLGWDYPTPMLWFDVEDAQDDVARMTVYTEGAKIPGMTYSISQIRREFAFDEPLDEADTLRIPTVDGDAGPVETFRAMVARAGLAAAIDQPSEREDISPGMQANDGVIDDSTSQAGDTAMENILRLVETWAATVDTPEQLLRKVRMSADSLVDDLAAAGLSQDDLEDIVSRVIITSLYNGESSADNEQELQLENA